MKLIDAGQKRSAHLLISASTIFILLISPHPSFQQDISEYRQRLSKLNKQIEDLKSKIKKEEKRELTTLSRLDRLGFTKNLIKKEIAAYNIRLERANRELSNIRKNIPPLREKLEKEKQSIEKILITMYKFGKFSPLRYMLQAEDIGSLIAESKNLGLLARYQERIVYDYMSTLTELRTAESELESKKDEIAGLIQNAKQKRRELEDQERKYRALVREIERNKTTHLKTLEELNERAEQLQTLIKKLLKREITLPFALVPLYEKKGKLAWPIEGKIITPFGLQRHPRFNTVTVNNGIEIAPYKDNMVVRSIHTGKVVYKDHFQGYGNLIIVDHGMNYYSLYGHCSDFLVDKGDFVEAGQPIALIGDLGSLKGSSLYLEIRFKTKPLDPLRWLKRR